MATKRIREKRRLPEFNKTRSSELAFVFSFPSCGSVIISHGLQNMYTAAITMAIFGALIGF